LDPQKAGGQIEIARKLISKGTAHVRFADQYIRTGNFGNMKNLKAEEFRKLEFFQEDQIKEMIASHCNMEKPPVLKVNYKCSVEVHDRLMIDRTIIKKHLDEILWNAVKYRDPNKEVLEITVNIEKIFNNYVRISIRDNGLGIMDLAGVMDGKREHQDIVGTGRGLMELKKDISGHITKNLECLLQIDEKKAVGVESEGPGQGTTVYFCLQMI
jgi:light-regulated signal transduction histidine kinase (bacteriophytochrome)